MTESPTPVSDWLSSAICGSLVAQVASKRGLDFNDLANDANRLSTETDAILQELHDLGVTGTHTTEHVMASLACLFMHPHNADTVVESFTGILWSILGDPERNGEKPPDIYRKAGFAMHVALLGFFDPSIPERVFKK